MMTPLSPRDTRLPTDEEMAETTRAADTISTTSMEPQPSLPPSGADAADWESLFPGLPIVGVFEWDPNAKPTETSPFQTHNHSARLPDAWFERFLHSCGQLAHDFAASLRDANRREPCAKVRQANNALISKALTEAASIAKAHCQFLELTAAVDRVKRERQQSEPRSAVGAQYPTATSAPQPTRC